MTEMLNTVRGAITLDIPTLVRFRDSEDVFRRGVIILVLVALVVGMVTFVVDLVGGLLASPEAEMAQATQGFQQALQFMPPEAAETFKKQFLDNFEAGVQIALQVEALPTRLPKGVDTFFQTLGGWVHRPLAMLGGFLGYAIWVMLAAKLLGGKGRLQEFLGTAALSSVPYLLLILQKVPCLGSVLGIVAWIWSAIILIVATAVAHGWAVPLTTAEGVVERYQVSWGKAVLAVILPVLALAVLVIFGVTVFAVIIAVAT
jgi:hypothetical protein